MGQFDGDLQNDVFGFSELPHGSTIAPEVERPYRLNVLTFVGWGALQLRIDYSREQFDERTIRALAGNFHVALSWVSGRFRVSEGAASEQLRELARAT